MEKHVAWVVFALFMAVALFGCDAGGDMPAAPVTLPPPVMQPAPTAVEACAAPLGSYHVHYEATSGDCGAFADETSVLPATGSPAGCAWKRDQSADQCTITTDIECTDGDGVATIRTAVVAWNKDATAATGTMAVALTPPMLTPAEAYARSIYGAPPLPAACSGVYSVTFARQ